MRKAITAFIILIAITNLAVCWYSLDSEGFNTYTENLDASDAFLTMCLLILFLTS